MEWTRESRVHDMEGVLHVDLAQQHRAIPNGVEIGIKLFQANDEFRLFSGQTAEVPPPPGSADPPTTVPYTSYKLTIVEASLKVAFMKLNPSVLLAHNRSFKIAPAVYPYWKSVVKTFGIPKGSHSFTIEDPFHGNKPVSVVAGLVLASAHSGNMLKSPLNFQHFFLNFLELTCDGVSMPSSAFQPQYTYNNSHTDPSKCYNNGYVTEYKRLFGDNYPQKDGNFIHLGTKNIIYLFYVVYRHFISDDFPGGYALYRFDLRPSADKHLFCPPEKAYSRISGRFAVELDEPVVMVLYAQFPAEFKIDETRLVVV